jgi:hypothetical protein
MSRRRSSMNHLHRRASVSFFHPSLFAERNASSRQSAYKPICAELPTQKTDIPISDPRYSFKNKVLSKRKEVKAYEEISGVICSYNVSCDFNVDWLQ